MCGQRDVEKLSHKFRLFAEPGKYDAIPFRFAYFKMEINEMSICSAFKLLLVSIPFHFVLCSIICYSVLLCNPFCSPLNRNEKFHNRRRFSWIEGSVSHDRLFLVLLLCSSTGGMVDWRTRMQTFVIMMRYECDSWTVKNAVHVSFQHVVSQQISNSHGKRSPFIAFGRGWSVRLDREFVYIYSMQMYALCLAHSLSLATQFIQIHRSRLQ